MSPAYSRNRSISTFSIPTTLVIGLLLCLGLTPGFAQAPFPALPREAPAKVRLLVKMAKGLSLAQQDAIVRGHGAAPKAAIPKLDLQIIEVPAQAADAITKQLKGDSQIRRVDADHTRKWQG